MHWGVLAALVDSGCSYSVIVRRKVALPVVDFHIDYYWPAAMGQFRIRTEIVRPGQRSSRADTRIFDSTNVLIASEFAVLIEFSV